MVFDTVSDLLDPVLLPQEEVEKEKKRTWGDSPSTLLKAGEANAVRTMGSS